VQEQGRYCGSCKKTVVDFNAYERSRDRSLSVPWGQDLCGRLASDQMERALSVRPKEPKSLWKGWHWLLGGLLFAGRVQGQTKSGGHRSVAVWSPVHERIVPVVEAGSPTP